MPEILKAHQRSSRQKREVDIVLSQLSPMSSEVDEFLNHNIRLSYLMESETICEKLHAELKSGAIFQFPYSYRGGLEADVGFLLMNTEGQVFFLVGDPTVIEFVGLQQAVNVSEDTVAEEDDAGDGLMDFGMI